MLQNQWHCDFSYPQQVFSLFRDKIGAMLRAKQKLTGEIIEAYFANKAQAPFYCPDCGDMVLLKTGRTKVNYFAHVNPLTCQFNTGESEAHENCKMQIFEALKQHPRVSNA